jgi:Cell wall-active antibiotics response 4TMS YvqF
MTNPENPSTTSIRVLGGHTWRGRRRLSRRSTLVSLIGGADLDLSEAEFPAEGATIVKVSLIGGVSIRLPEHVRVAVSGFTLIGGQSVDDPGTDGPVLTVQAYGILGGVRVRRVGA